MLERFTSIEQFNKLVQASAYHYHEHGILKYFKILFQNEKSQTLNLFDIIPEVENTLNPYTKIIHFHYHSTENYYKEIKNKHNEIENILKMRKNIKPNGRLVI